MLQPNTIPDNEPILRVGIVLPEDNKNTLSMVLPGQPAYQITSGSQTRDQYQLHELTFTRDGDKIRLGDSEAATSWRIAPAETFVIGPEKGILVREVIAGRGFHWQKPVEVFLPGALEVQIHEGYLTLTNELPLEEYLMCVATSEMGAACPAALIESQTIAARSWMLANIEQKHVHMGMDVCNDDCCQRYQGTGNLSVHAMAGARNSCGQVVLYDQKICDARYSKSCGGMMETFDTIWGGKNLPYLQNRPDAESGLTTVIPDLTNEPNVREWIDSVPQAFCSSHLVPEASIKKYLGSVDEEGTYFRWEFTYTQAEFCDLLNNKRGLDAHEIIALRPVSRGGSGRLHKLEIIYSDASGQRKSHLIPTEYEIRQALHKGFLYSSCLYSNTDPQDSKGPETIILKGGGWGHGVGFCQIGALGMSLNGYTAAQIVAHYYPGSKLVKIYS